MGGQQRPTTTRSSGIVTISHDKNLVVLNGTKHVIWSSNVSTFVASNSTAQLLDTGNLVLVDDTTGKTIWESFKHPSDTFLPNMIISTNQKTGEKVKATSWKSPSDPAIGNFSGSLDRLSAPEVFVWKQSQPFWRSGPWNGQVFIGLASNLMYTSAYLNGFSIGRGENDTVEITYTLPNNSFFGTIVVSPEGKLVYTAWINRFLVGKRVFQENDCDVYGFCGPYGSCDSNNSPICTCLRGFEPRNVDEWNRQNWTSGCVRKDALQCERVKNGSEAGEGDGFLKLQMTKVPDFAQQSYLSVDACRTECLKNCSCTAYAYDDGIGCLSWSGKLIDIVRFSSGGVDLYIRQPHSELLDVDGKRNVTAIIIVSVIVGAVIVATCTYFLWSWTSKRTVRRKERQGSLVLNTGETHLENRSVGLIGDVKQVKIEDLPLFDFRIIATSTNNFDSANKLGQGPSQKKVLDWQKRLNIIEGISRGLLYLHRDSRLRIIHRDLKPSNILLDGELNPKISDFGMARIFGGSENEANTRRIVGTYGYMSPEYAMEGLFSEKSDVFSFGVLLLEIISGRKNTSFYKHEQSLSLLGYAWKLWNEEEIVSLIDPDISNPDCVDHILRCIHIGLLSVQEFAKERPTMATIVSMLNSEIVNFPAPRQPAFTQRQIEQSGDSSQLSHDSNSINNVTVTNLQGR
ncbi:S-locus glycoprotein domain [Sesbania bispinosa]|nr:S-locus glycoprotein domain [Sesbania bispinosa]